MVKKSFVIHGSRVCRVGELQVGCVDKCPLGSSLLPAPSPRPWALLPIALVTKSAVLSSSFLFGSFQWLGLYSNEC